MGTRFLNHASLENALVHEIGHVLGIGTTSLWASFLESTSSATPRFNGENAIDGLAELGGSGKPKIEPTVLGHWSEAYGTEMMTPQTDILMNEQSAISILTVKALIDLGYSVNENRAEHFELPAGVRRRAEQPEDNDDKNI